MFHKWLAEYRVPLLGCIVCILATVIFFLWWWGRPTPYVVVTNSIGGTSTLTVDGSKRAIVAKGDFACAEPAPDAMATLAAEFGASFSANPPSGQDSANAASVFVSSLTQTDVVQLFKRSQGIQALRDGMYRLCEARMNGAIGNDFYEEQMIDLVATLNFIVPLELCANASLGSVPGERPEGKTDQEGPTVSGGKPMDPEAVKPTENAAVNAAVSEIDVAPGSPLGAAAAAASDLSTSIATGREPALLALSVEYMKTCATLAQEFGLKVSQNASERMLFRREAARAERISLAQYREYLENSGTQKASPAQN